MSTTATTARAAPRADGAASRSARVRAYWDAQLHDAAASESAIGTAQFFRDLDTYRLGKLDYLTRVVDFSRRDSVLEIGCGVGLDAARFARAGATVVGVDLSTTATALARQNARGQGLPAAFLVGDGAALPFANESFDLVYCHGVLPYAAEPEPLIREAHRVLKVGGEAVFMAYHRWSWLMLLSRIARVRLEHSDAPVFRVSTRRELRGWVSYFDDIVIVTERFPTVTVLQSGARAAMYNALIVPLFHSLPTRWIRAWGWHLLAFCRKLR